MNDSNEGAASTLPSDEIQRDPGKGITFLSVKDGPYHPIINLKKEIVGGKTRSFNLSWYNIYSWLEYSILKNAAFCFCCPLFCKEKSGKGEDAFTQKGMSNWKKALEKFRVHQTSDMYLKCMQFWKEYRSAEETVSDKLSSAHTTQVKNNRAYIKFIFENILFLEKQCLALRGHDESDASINKGNFLELLNLRCAYKRYMK